MKSGQGKLPVKANQNQLEPTIQLSNQNNPDFSLGLSSVLQNPQLETNCHFHNENSEHFF